MTPDEKSSELEAQSRKESAGARPGGSVRSGPSWLERLSEEERQAEVPPALGNGVPPAEARRTALAGARPGPEPAVSAETSPVGRPKPRHPGEDSEEHMERTQLALERFREEALRAAREDAAAGVPSLELEGISHSEAELRERARAFFERWHSAERTRLDRKVAETEERVADHLGRASIALDRFERLTNDLVRLKARLSVRRQEVNEALGEEKVRKARPRGIPTRVYLAAIGFLGLVEFFANAPVFGALLPRDPLTERQIRLVAETSEGWFAGAQRVFAQFILRPDAALLAAGVVTFLCVLAHFFGHSLRDFVMQRDRAMPRDTVSARSPLESLVPMILSAAGLVLVIGVLYVARVTLGDVGEKRFEQDMAVVEDLRRQAGWLRVDGNLLEANDMTNRAEDMQAAAAELREYAGSMSRLSLPILLLNTTLVLCAISAAYFHRRDRTSEYFDDTPFEIERHALVDAAEAAASEITRLLTGTVRHLRELRNLLRARPLMQFRSVVHQLEAAVALYRTENGRARGLDPRTIPAFQSPVALDVQIDPRTLEEPYASRDPDEYEQERKELKQRFEEVRRRFTAEAVVG